MHPKIVYCVAILSLAIVVFSPDGVQSECCNPPSDNKCGKCGPPPGDGHWFCGVGGCNIFGCRCDGGCRKGDCPEKRSLDDQINGEDGVDAKTGNDVVRQADTDADGALNVTEVKLFLGRSGIVVEIDAFRALDVDGDGKLTAREIDPDLI